MEKENIFFVEKKKNRKGKGEKYLENENIFLQLATKSGVRFLDLGVRSPIFWQPKTANFSDFGPKNWTSDAQI